MKTYRKRSFVLPPPFKGNKRCKPHFGNKWTFWYSSNTWRLGFERRQCHILVQVPPLEPRCSESQLCHLWDLVPPHFSFPSGKRGIIRAPPLEWALSELNPHRAWHNGTWAAFHFLLHSCCSYYPCRKFKWKKWCWGEEEVKGNHLGILPGEDNWPSSVLSPLVK